jgi:hypothetical protein
VTVVPASGLVSPMPWTAPTSAVGAVSQTPAGAAAAAALSAAAGWALGAWLCQHPIVGELLRAGSVLSGGLARLKARPLAPVPSGQLGGQSQS